MNNFCIHLRLSLSQRFNIDVDVYVSKKKKLIHMPLVKLLFSYRSFEEIIDFVKSYWQKRKFFFPGYFFIYPKLKQSLKWRYNYVLIAKNKPTTKKMDDLLGRFYENMKFSLKRKFSRYIVKLSQVKGSFYVLMRKPRGKTLNDNLNFMFENVKYNDSRQGACFFRIEIDETSDFYFCNHFYKGFKRNVKGKGASVLKPGLSGEVIGCCSDCRKKNCNYLRNTDTLSNDFFLRHRNF